MRFLDEEESGRELRPLKVVITEEQREILTTTNLRLGSFRWLGAKVLIFAATEGRQILRELGDVLPPQYL
jgi:hypothetical protein